MAQEEKNRYQLFTKEILNFWIQEEVEYIKVEEIVSIDGTTLFELIPDAELLDGGDTDIFYPIGSEDVLEMLLPSTTVRFVVHDIYLSED